MARLNTLKTKALRLVFLIANDAVPYQQELQKIKQMGMYPILDIEHVIWDGAKKQSIPIQNFTDAFSMWKRAGWMYVASEGGRTGDLEYLRNYFSRFTFFNCDKCGIWKHFHVEPLTSEVSWEMLYSQEISYIQTGAPKSYALGKGQGILAGVWSTNNDCLNLATYKALLDWSYANNVGFTHFQVFFGVGPTLADYKRLGFETIISQLQQYYPPKHAPSLSSSAYVTNVRLVPDAPRYLMWDVTNTGNIDIWVAPYAKFYKQNTALGYAAGAVTIGYYTYNGDAVATTLKYNGLGWVKVPAGKSITVFSPGVVPLDAKWAVYNAYVYDSAFNGWLYNDTAYSTMR
jgi:hypothetical protein